MKKALIPLLLILTLLLTGCSGLSSPAAGSAKPTATATNTPVPTPTPTPTPKPVSPEVQALQVRNAEVWREMHRRDGMDGRLMIPSAGINVALFTWIDASVAETDPDKIVEQVRQLIVDYEDSALLYNDGLGNVIADHSNQDLLTLSTVKPGDPAYLLAGDHVVSLVCDLVTDGINTGTGITDSANRQITAGEDYTCYTCLEDWTHIQVVGFKITDQDFFDVDRFDVVGKTPRDGETASAQSAAATPVPAQVTPASATPMPTPTPIYTPVVSPTPSPTPTAEPRRNDPADTNAPYYDYYDILGGYDIYADADSSGASSSVDGGYLT